MILDASYVTLPLFTGGPKNNRNLNVARKLEIVARYTGRCRDQHNILAVCCVASI
jgi:hypothetical protein